MFDAQIFQIKQRFRVTLKSLGCALVILIASAVALAFFCAAGFIWLQHAYGTINACMIAGGVCAVAAVMAAIMLNIMRRRAKMIAELAAKLAPPRPAQWWNHPSLLAAGLELSRTYGRRRGASVGLLAAFLVGILLSQSSSGKDTPKK